MNTNGFDSNEEKDPWEYEDYRPDAQDQQPASQNGTVEGESEESTPSPESTKEESEFQTGDSSVGDSSTGAETSQNESPTQDDVADQSSQNPEQPPYPPYGQYNSPYGSPNYGPTYNGNPYGTPPYGQPTGNPYGPAQPQNNGAYGNQGNQAGSPPNGPQYYDNPYGQSYWNYPYNGQYGGQPYPPTQPPKNPNKGLKVFFGVLGILVAALILSTIFYSYQMANMPLDDSSSASSAVEGGTGSGSFASSSPLIGGVEGNGTDPDSGGITVQPHPSGSALTATEVYKQVIQSVVGIQATIPQSGTSEGTGIIASSDGYILTNAHVINYSKKYTVKVVLHDNKSYEATVVGYDKTSDLAVLKINATGLSPATFGSVDGMEVGDRVIAIGNPGGLSFAGSLTGGYISALDRTIEEHSENGMTYIQTDAAINPGNSGGPLVNLYGQVIGINSNKIVATGYEGMGFAIPISRAKSIINDLIAHGYVSGRTRLGIKAKTVETIYSQLYGYPQGVLIVSIDSDSALNGSSVVQGDIIIEADGSKIVDMDGLYAVLTRHKPGDTIQIKVYSTSLSETAGGGKAGTTREVSVTLLEDKGETQ